MRPKPFWWLITIIALVFLLPFFILIVGLAGVSAVSSTCSGSSGGLTHCTSWERGRAFSYTCGPGDCDAAREAALRAQQSPGERIRDFLGKALILAFFPLEILLILAGVVIVAYERGWVRQRPTT